MSFLDGVETIAIVGLSDKPERASYGVARYLADEGFRIIPVNPLIHEWMGVPAYASVSEIPGDIKVDVVDIFRKSEFVADIVKEVVSRGDARMVWMQEGVVNEGAAELAREHGLEVVMNMCLMKRHRGERER